MTATFMLTGELEPTVGLPVSRSAYVQLDRPVVDATNDVTYAMVDRVTVGPEFTLTGLPAKNALNNSNTDFNLLVTIGARQWLVPAQPDGSTHDLTEFPETTNFTVVGVDSAMVTAAQAAATAAAASAAAAAASAATVAASPVPRYFTGDKTVYVSTSGSDSNDGRAQGTAFLTIGAALSALSTGGVIQLGAGGFQLSAAIAITTRVDITIRGAGPNRSQIVVNGNYNAFTLTGVCTRIRFEDLWVGTFAARTSGMAFSIVGTSGVHSDNITMRNVVIQNLPQAVNMQYVDLGIMDRVKYIQSIDGATISGSLFRLINCASHDIDRLIAVRTTAANMAGDALVIDSDTDTIIINRAELGDCQTGMIFRNTTGGAATGPRLIRVTDCYAERVVNSGFLVSAGRDIRFKGAHSAVNTAGGFDISGGTSIKLTDCIALQNGVQGYYIHGSAIADVRLMGCDASNNGQNGAVYDGIRIEDSTSHVRVIGCRSGDYVFGGGTQRYGLSVGATATDYIVAQGNDFSGNVTASVGNFSTGTHNSVVNNVT